MSIIERIFPREPRDPNEVKPSDKKRTLFTDRPILLWGSIAIVVLGAGAFITLAYRRQQEKPLTCTGTECNVPSATEASKTVTASPSPSPTPAPKVARALDGVLVASGDENLHPLAVMIENHPDARPQSGLSSANLVYEAIAEGGITRFMAVFADPRQDIRVGPVRSARTYFLDFATELNAFYAHVGGNIDALDQIKNEGGVFDLDQFAVGAPVFARDFSRSVALEHTMYSTTQKLWEYAVSTKHYSPQGKYTSWSFVDSPDATTLPASQKVTVDFSEASYKVVWDYDKTTNSYARSMAGKPHVDATGDQPITAKNIVLEVVSHTPIVTRINEHGWKDTLVGSGKAVIITNGTATVGTWKKQGTDRTIYYDANGKEMSFVRGTTWVEVVHPETPISY
jgi:hypothetical protein